MDRWQRVTLRRKKILLAEMFDFSPASQEEFKQHGLLTEEMVPDVLVSCNFCAPRRYLTAVFLAFLNACEIHS